ncbi:MAG TPA: hypothetical protein VGQ77_17350 [Methylomirabilota bacterium]|nr:hypothetical protein [Methylomirabilota bacterium]
MLACARRYRTLATWLFVLLIGLVAGERRLAEAHFNLRSAAAPGLESDDVLDGDEIRVRLVVLNDDKTPTLPDVSGALVCEVVHAHAQRLDSLALGRPAPRGPPLSAPSSA